MHKVISILLVSGLLLACTGCGLLEREYVQISQHQEQTAENDDATTLRAESYAELVGGAQYFVSMGVPSGTVRLYQYTGDIQKAVDRACEALLQDDPLGSYALQDVQCQYTRIVSYYECVFTYQYRRSMEQIAAIQTLTGKGDFREKTAKTLEQFQDRLVLKSDSYYQSEESVRQEFWDVFYDTPQAAVAKPELTVHLYPNHGAARVIELDLEWPRAQQELLERATAVSEMADKLTAEVNGEPLTQVWTLYNSLVGYVSWQADGSDSVSGALVEGKASSEGIAMAYELLCDRVGIECQVVRGQYKNQDHCWNLVTIDDQSWHLDVTAGEGKYRFLRSDEELTEQGYAWSQEDYPVCTLEAAIAARNTVF